MCRLACKRCVACEPGDVACFNKNRADGGFIVLDESELKLAELGTG